MNRHRGTYNNICKCGAFLTQIKRTVTRRIQRNGELLSTPGAMILTPETEFRYLQSWFSLHTRKDKMQAILSSSPPRNHCNLLKISKLQWFFYFLSPKNSPKNLPFTTDSSQNFGVVGYEFIQFFTVELPALPNLVLNGIFLQHTSARILISNSSAWKPGEDNEDRLAAQ